MYPEQELLEAEMEDFFSEGEPDPFAEIDYEGEAAVLPEPQSVFGELEGGGEVDGYAEYGGEGLEGEEADFEAMFGEQDEYGESMYGLDGYESGDPEAEFFKKIGGWVKKAARTVGRVVKKAVPAIKRAAGPLLKKLAPIAAKAVGGFLGGPAGAAVAGTVANAVLREAETETEAGAGAAIADGEIEFEQAGGNPDAFELMEVNAATAAATPSAPAADAAIAKMATAAAGLFRDNPRLRPALADVVKATIALATILQRNPQTRWAVRTVPLIVKRSLTRLARAPQITKRAIIETLSHEIAWVLANRARATAALRRHHLSLRRAPLHVRPRPGRPVRPPFRRPARVGG